MEITAKEQVTIPVEVREQLGLRPGDEVEFIPDENGVRLVKTERTSSRGRRMVERLTSAGEGVLRTDEIIALTRDE